MKRIACFILTALLAVNIVCAKSFFSQRYFEIITDIPFDMSNNSFSLSDFMKKDLVIDLRKIADDMPKEGFTGILNVNPSFFMNFNIKGVSAGIKVGANAYGKFNLSKDIFDFLGYGYKAGDSLNIKVNPVVDLFAFTEIPVSFSISKFRIGVNPSMFIPIATVDDCDISIVGYNSVDGKVGAKLNADMNFYVSEIYDSLQKGQAVNFTNAMQSMGFDLGGFFEMPFFVKNLTMKASARVPIWPGKLDRKVNMKYSMDYEMNIQDMLVPPPTEEKTPEGSKPEGESKPVPEENSAEPAAPTFSDPVMLAEPYYINRPLKANVMFIYKPYNFLTLEGGGGIGVRHPFTDSFYCYPEYYAGVTLSLIDLLKLSLSTEYTDQMFKHELVTVFNLRVLEIDTGVSFQSGDFVQSFKGAGFGANLTFAFGF